MYDVVCLGESMVTFVPSVPGPLADVPSFARGIGGAESNAACALAAAGHRVRWVSRVGADGFGDHLVREIGAYGVDVSGVVRDPERPTGVYFRTAGERVLTEAEPLAGEGVVGAANYPVGGGWSGAVSPPSQAGTPRQAEPDRCEPHGLREPYGLRAAAAREAAARSGAAPRSEVAYYRAGSAASALAPADADAVPETRVLHLTGITAALSADCLALLRVLTAPRPGRPLVSFDVNHRPALWRGRDAPGVLRELARRADTVFVGDDEAAALWGHADPAAIRDALPEPDVLVVKQGAAGATAYAGGEAVHVPAPAVDVVAPTGAGDAFAAGYLSAALAGLPLAARLRHGHLWAAAALTVPGDLAAPPLRAHADELAALDADAWSGLRLGPGWTRAASETRVASAPHAASAPQPASETKAASAPPAASDESPHP